MPIEKTLLSKYSNGLVDVYVEDLFFLSSLFRSIAHIDKSKSLQVSKFPSIVSRYNSQVRFLFHRLNLSLFLLSLHLVSDLGRFHNFCHVINCFCVVVTSKPLET
jgi:hypothetical protein